KTKVTKISVLDKEAAEVIGKPVGEYITVELDEFSYDTELLDDRMKSISTQISSLLPKGDGTVLVAGIGNKDITPDALGPRCAEGIFSTRHITSELAEEIGLDRLNPVCSLATGVLGQTGIETGEIIKSVADAIKPKAVIVIDALAAAGLERLGRTVQITDTGITPGSGVGNKRAEISKNTLGVPVIAIGVPTVVDAVTLAKDMTGNKIATESAEAQNMMVTPREIDVMIERASKLIALCVNCALQPKTDPELLLSVV
ncbi:MAG: GPR endopeptidase, partial [Oscillospiraceae bacterium]|nr:GPR endopeptidase [Oscillospiraceae bacterium]